MADIQSPELDICSKEDEEGEMKNRCGMDIDSEE